MATKIVTKNSSTASAVPTASDLVQGELAVNVADKRLFTEDNGGAVVELGTNPSTIDINAGTIDGTAIGASSASTGAFTTLTASGAVGIGTSLPNFSLQLDSNRADATFNADNVSTWADFKIQGDTASGNARGIYFDFDQDTGNDKGAGIVGISGDASGGVGSLGFITTSGNVSAERMRIDSSGNVGIGTSSPISKMHIVTAANGSTTIGSASDELVLENNGDCGLTIRSNTTGTGVISFADDDDHNMGQVYYDHATDAMVLVANDAERMRIDSSGNVGIGCTPATLLDIKEGTAATDAIIGLTAGTGGRAQIRSEAQADNTSSELSFHTMVGSSTAERMRIDSSGNVGIGTSNNSLRLDVSASGGTTYPTLGTASGVIGASVGELHGMYFGVDGSSGNGWIQAMREDGTATAYNLVLQPSGGNVGIGTSSPVSAVSIQKGSGANAYIEVAGNNNTLASASMLYGQDSGSYGYCWNRANQAILFGTNSLERMRIDSSGNVMVGKSAINFTTVGAELRSNGSINSGSTVDFLNMFSTSASAYRFYVTNAGTIKATSTTISAISDQRFKENIRDLDDGLSKVMELRPRKFDWKEGKGADIKDDRGFIAQEFEQVFPDLVGEWKEEAPEGEEPYKAVSQDLIPTLVKAIQEQQTLIESLTTRIAALEE